MRDGGTQKWCPKCEEWRVVKAVSTSSIGEGSGQHRYMQTHQDIKFFRRGQECQTCWHEWVSVEVPRDFIYELIKLRNALSGIKKNAEVYSRESEIAAESLSRLSKSLSDLTALK